MSRLSASYLQRLRCRALLPGLPCPSARAVRILQASVFLHYTNCAEFSRTVCTTLASLKPPSTYDGLTCRSCVSPRQVLRLVIPGFQR